MPKSLFTLLLFLLSFSAVQAQTPTVQDCAGAIPICQLVYTDTAAYSGTGSFPNEINSANSCLGGAGEINSVWYETTIQSSGNFGFTLTPSVSSDDYDWAVYDITNNTCSDIYNNAALELSCNFSGVSGNTGPNNGSGAPFEATIPVTQGQHLVIVLTNWSSSPNGYTVDFGVSTANPVSGNCNPNCADSTYAVSITELDSISCIGSCDAKVIANVTGGSPPYSYTWSNGAQGVGLNTLNGVCEGWITVTVDDATGCSLTAAYYVNAPPQITIAEAITNISCPGVCDGAVTVTPSGGLAPYTYSWVEESSGATIGGTATISDLCPGDFTVYVADANGCQLQQTYTVLDAIPMSLASYATTDATCGLCDGSATFTIAGGTPPYSYSGNPMPVNDTVTGLCAGVYTLTVTDATGCVANFAIGISETGGPAVSFSEQPASCQQCNGVGTVSVTSTNPPYTFDWYSSNGLFYGSGPQLLNMCADDYVIVVSDSSGCSTSIQAAITENAPLTLAATSTPTTCGSGCSGTITAGSTGGAGGNSYYLDGALMGTTSVFDSLCAGTYIVSVVDSIGCSSTDTITVVNNSNLTVDAFFSTDVICGAPCSGTANVSVSGGTLPYTYIWNGVNGTSSNSNLCEGSQVLTIQDNGGCILDTIFVINPDTSVVIQNIVVTDATCGQCNGSLEIIALGATEYSIDGSTWQTSNVFTNLCASNYFVYARDSAGCLVNVTVAVADVSTISATVSNDSAICPNTCVQLVASGLSSYTWTPSASLDNANIATPLACPTTDTDYCVFGTDSNGCSSDTACVSITLISPSSFSISPDVTISYGDSILICAFPIAGPYTYSWSNGNTQPCQTVQPDSTTTYTVTVTDSCGGNWTDSVTVTVLGGIGYDDLPNAAFEFDVYPNPAVNEAAIALTLNSNARVQWQLLDVIGRKIDESNARNLTAGNHQLRVPMEAVSANGVYFLQIIVDDKLQSAKIVVNR